MGNLFGDLQNATKALSAHSLGVTTAGNNIANVNNADYSRQRVMLGDRGTIMTSDGPRSLGVEALGLEQIRDSVLDKEVLREASLNGSLEAQLAALDKAEASTGQTITRVDDSAFIDGSSGSDSGGLADGINSFFNALHSLSANPSADAEKEALMQESDKLTEQFNVISERFSDIQEDLTLKVETDLGEANQMIKEISELNVEVARAEAGGAGQALELRDQRQAKLEDLSQLVQINVSDISGSGGQIRVTMGTPTGESVDLVEHGRYSLIEMETSDAGLTSFRLANQAADEVVVKGGAIHGSLLARDGQVQTFKDELDKLAFELVTQVNELYSNSGADSNFFSDTGDSSEFTAAGIKLDSTLDTATLRTTNNPDQDAGDNSLILAIAELDGYESSYLGNQTLSSHYRGFATDLAEKVSTVNSRLDDEKLVFDLLKQQQDSVSGVSMDEEVADMMKYQRAYQATGKLISAIDEMLDVVINRIN